MTEHSFKAILFRPEGVGTWTYLNIPLDVSSTFGTKSQVKVKGTINGYAFRSTALPMGDGTHYLVVGKDIRDQIHSTQGDSVSVVLELDLEERHVVIPDDLAQALAGNPQVKSVFENLSYSHQNEYVDWIQSAKKAETRQSRIEKALVLLGQGAKLRG